MLVRFVRRLRVQVTSVRLTQAGSWSFHTEQCFFGVLPAAGIFARHVRGLAVRDSFIHHRTSDEREPVVFYDVHEVAFSLVWRDSGDTVCPVVLSRPGRVEG